MLMAGFYAVIDLLNFKRWSFPLVVIGLNSIAAYLIAHLFDGFIFKALKTHLGKNAFKISGDSYEPLLHGAAVLGVYWLILFWMYRRKIFLRISREALMRAVSVLLLATGASLIYRAVL